MAEEQKPPAAPSIPTPSGPEAKLFRSSFSISQAFSITNLIILIVGTLFSLIILGILVKTKHEEVRLRLENRAELARHTIDEVVQTAIDTVRDMAEQLPVHVNEPAKDLTAWMEGYARKRLSKHPVFFGVYFGLSAESAQKIYGKPELLFWVLKDARLIGQPNFHFPSTYITNALSDTNYLQRTSEAWYHGAVHSQNVSFTPPYFDTNYSKHVVISVTKSTRDLKTGRLIGIVGVDFAAFGLADLLRNLRFDETGGVFITDSRGQALAPFLGEDVPLLGFQYDPANTTNPKFPMQVENAPVLDVTGGAHEAEGVDGEKYFYQIRKLTARPGYALAYAVSYQKKTEAYSSLYWTAGMMMLMATVFLAISLFFRQRLARFVIDSIETILSNIEKNRDFFSKGESEGFDHIRPGGPREIAKISTELNLLYVRLQNAFAEVHQEKERAELATKVKSRFLSVMSHEIRTPLNSMLGLTDVLLLTPLNSEQARHLRVLQRSGQSLLRILNDILDFSRLEAGKLQIEAHEFDLYELLYDIESLMRFEAESKGIRFIVTAPKSNYRLYGDSIRIRQAILNLVGNAIKFTSKGSIEIRVSEVGSQDVGIQKFRFEVIDTGIGMTAESLSRIFSEFSQGDSSITRRYGGTGLGLVISRQIVTLLGGELLARSEYGKGSCFEFTIPIQVRSSVPSDYQTTMGSKLPGSESGIRKILPSETRLKPDTRVGVPTERFVPIPTPLKEGQVSILVVDDDEDNHRLIDAYLKFRENVRAEHAFTAAEALEKLKARRFALVLMDMQMPEVDGLDATQEIRRLQKLGELPPCPIIMLSANTFAEDQQKSIAAGADEHVGKPLKLERFNELLTHWIS